jgi:NAD(P)-dependent dehydrogenase (short-subunit alcohol dehydrogenase family)
VSYSQKARTALVTGAGGGIGGAVALQLAATDVAVFLVARARDELAETAKRITLSGGAAYMLPADLAVMSEVDRVADRAAGVDILINTSAVVWPLAPRSRVDPGEWATAIRISLLSVAALTFALLPPMLDRGWGRVVNVSSGIFACPEATIGGSDYAAGKSALEAHTINLAAELANSGVTVNAFRPGAVDPGMRAWVRNHGPAQIGEAFHERFSLSHAEGMLISPARSAGSLIARLDSDVTGAIFDVSDTL